MRVGINGRHIHPVGITDMERCAECRAEAPRTEAGTICPCDCGCEPTNEWHSEPRCVCRALQCRCIEAESPAALDVAAEVAYEMKVFLHGAKSAPPVAPGWLAQIEKWRARLTEQERPGRVALRPLEPADPIVVEAASRAEGDIAAYAKWRRDPNRITAEERCPVDGCDELPEDHHHPACNDPRHDEIEAWYRQALELAAPPAVLRGADAAEWHRYLHAEGILVEDEGEECGPWHHRVFMDRAASPAALDEYDSMADYEEHMAALGDPHLEAASPAALDVEWLESQIREWHDSSEPARSFAERIAARLSRRNK